MAIKKASLPQKIADSTSKGAMAGILNELFQDMYKHRWQIYKMNFVRGLLFGLGSVVGGTIVIFLLIWVLSLFDQVPLVGGFVDSMRHSLERTP